MDAMLGRVARQHEAAIAIPAVDIALLVDLEPYAWMAERGGAKARAPADRAGPVAGDPASVDNGDFGYVDHAPAVIAKRALAQPVARP